MELDRRELLGIFAYILTFATSAIYFWSEFDAYKGCVIEKQIVLHDSNRHRRVIAVNEDTNLSTEFDKIRFLLNDTGSTKINNLTIKINNTQMKKVRDIYQDIEFKLLIDIYDSNNNSNKNPKEITTYNTSRIQFNQVSPGDHVSFQISILDKNELVSFSRVLNNSKFSQDSC